MGLSIIHMSTESLLPLLRLFQLVSPSLPVGAYSYSQGLEWAVEEAWVTNEETASGWIEELLRHALVKTEGPVLIRLSQSWQAGDTDALVFWNQFILATRETHLNHAKYLQLQWFLVEYDFQQKPHLLQY